MRIRFLLTTAIASAAISGSVLADQYRTAGTGGVWDSNTTWEIWNGLAWVPTTSTTQFPHSGDKANVQPGDTATLDSDEAVGFLVIEANATSTVAGTVVTESNVLTIDGTYGTQALEIQASGAVEGLLDVSCGVVTAGTVKLTSSDTHTVDGELRLSCFQSALDIDETLSIGGTGSIVGQNDWAEIYIQGGETFTNNATIEGQLIIKSGISTVITTLVNNGLIHANVSGTLEIANTVTIGALTAIDLDYEWTADTSSAAILKFSGANTSCINRGDFLVTNCATLDFAASVSTTGTFTCVSSPGGRVTGAGSLTYDTTCGSTASGCGICPG